MKKLFMSFIIIVALVLVPNVYAEEVNLRCNIDSNKGTCTAVLNTETHVARVTIHLIHDQAIFGEPTMEVDGEPLEFGVDPTSTDTTTKTVIYDVPNVMSAETVIDADVHFKTYQYADPECPEGGGTVIVEPHSPVEYDEEVTIKVRPDDCFEVDKIEVKGATETYEVTKGADGNYTFKMPGEPVTISVYYKEMKNCKVVPTPTPTPKGEDVKVPDTDTYSYLTTFLTLIVISGLGIALYKKAS